MSQHALNPTPANLRRSERTRKPAPDRTNIYTDSPSPKRRRTTRKSYIVDTPPNPNANCPFLKLSYDIFDQIASYLHPREAIFLSLASRYLYFGPLSAENSFLWYKLGDFKQLVPGHDKRWIENARWYFLSEVSDEEKSKIAFNLCRDERKDPDDAIAKKLTLGRKILPALSPLKKYYPASEGLPPTGVSYRDMLVQTMLGDTLSGCQWCLNKPLTHNVYDGWGLRVCHGCFYRNAVSLHDLRKVNIDTSSLGVATGKCMGFGGRKSGVWMPTVQRLIRASYGPRASLSSVLTDLWEIDEKKKKEREAARGAYRARQQLLIFEYIKILWDFLGKASPAPHPQALDELRATEQGAWLPSNESLSADVQLCAPIASLLPASELKLEWFLHDVPSNPHRHLAPKFYDPTAKGHLLELGRPWMRYDLKRDQKSDFLAIAAWKIICSVIARLRNCVPPTAGATAYRVGDMKQALSESFGSEFEKRGRPGVSVSEGCSLQKELFLWWGGENLFPAMSDIASIPDEKREIIADWKVEFESRKQGVWIPVGEELHRLALYGPGCS